MRSCSGVLVILLVVLYSVEVTNTSPLMTIAISLPLGESAMAEAPEENVRYSISFSVSSLRRVMAILDGCEPSFMV